MFVNSFIMFSMSSHFFQAYIQSDLLGKLIFLALLLTSIICWAILLHKIWANKVARRNANDFRETLQKQKGNLLTIEEKKSFKGLNPFFELFAVLKKQTVDLLNKNRRFSKGEGVSYLSPSDIDSIEGHMQAVIANQLMVLEGNLFILSTIVGLAPLLGLLGTVWGILSSFSQMQSSALSTSSQVVLGGIALALTTTVLGLIIAIPSLIAYNYLKNGIRHFEIDMEAFSNEMLSSIEMQYRKVDVHGPSL